MVCDRPPCRIHAPVDSLRSVWIVSSEQLLAWTQNPTRVADLNNFTPLKCPTPQVDAKVCDGIPHNEAGLLAHCPFTDFPFDTCVGDQCECIGSSLMVAFSTGAPRRSQLPLTLTPSSQYPPATNHGSVVCFSCTPQIAPRLIRCSVPANCSTPFWDPIGVKCLCASDNCAFADESRPIGVSALDIIRESPSFSFLRHSPMVPVLPVVELVGIPRGMADQTATLLSTEAGPCQSSFPPVGGIAPS